MIQLAYLKSVIKHWKLGTDARLSAEQSAKMESVLSAGLDDEDVFLNNCVYEPTKESIA